jgi:site-specific recombinase XerD
MPGRGRFKAIEAWPAADRERWQRGLSPASLLGPTGHAAKWRPETAKKSSRGWATYLNWLDVTGQLDCDEPPEQRISSERIQAYCGYLIEGIKPTAVRSRLDDLVSAFSVLAPLADESRIKRYRNLYPRQGDPLAKRARMQESATLLQLGLDLMAEAADLMGDKANLCYRDGLMIAVLACRPLRLRNLSNIELRRHLLQQDEHWSLLFEAKETKTHREWTSAWPAFLVPHLERYLEVYRPRLIRGHHGGDGLWISIRSHPLSSRGVYLAVTRRTRAAFGRSVNPHLFRDAAATSLAIHDPSNVQLARHVLGHSDYRTTQASYNQAQCVQASASLNEAMHRLRRKPR